MRQAVEQGGGQLLVAREHGDPFREAEIRRQSVRARGSLVPH